APRRSTSRQTRPAPAASRPGSASPPVPGRGWTRRSPPPPPPPAAGSAPGSTTPPPAPPTPGPSPPPGAGTNPAAPHAAPPLTAPSSSPRPSAPAPAAPHHPIAASLPVPTRGHKVVADGTSRPLTRRPGHPKTEQQR